MLDCVFCKIAAGELPATKIYEDAQFVAFLDIRPVQPGHVLIIPRSHYENLTATPAVIVGRFFQLAQKIASAVIQGTGADGCNMTMNNGRAAGQVVFHTHIHIIPRKDDDGLGTWPQLEYQGNAMQEVAENIKSALKVLDLRS
ncbi:MAG: HIT family protein [Candidatus Kerfeldbacteria bacterium]|nr:HIT family protein [Candidatus Kerfeldbacteria bacterium]